MEQTNFRPLPAAGEPARIVAEISNAHNGDEDLAHELIDIAADADAGAVKFQCYTPDELIALRGDGPAPEPWGSQGQTMRSLYERARTPFEWFPRLVEHCRDLSLPWFSSVFGPASFAVLQMLGCAAYKLSALDRRAIKLREMVASAGKPVVRSLPMLRPPKPRPGEALLYCPPGYPQRHLNASAFQKFRYDGFSYHGTNPLTPAVAIARGARIVEVHVHSAEKPSELEANVSLNGAQLRMLVKTARDFA